MVQSRRGQASSQSGADTAETEGPWIQLEHNERIKVTFNIPLTSRHSGDCILRSKKRMWGPSVSSDGQGKAYRPFFTVVSSPSVIHSAGPAMHAQPLSLSLSKFFSTFTFHVLWSRGGLPTLLYFHFSTVNFHV